MSDTRISPAPSTLETPYTLGLFQSESTQKTPTLSQSDIGGPSLLSSSRSFLKTGCETLLRALSLNCKQEASPYFSVENLIQIHTTFKRVSQYLSEHIDELAARAISHEQGMARATISEQIVSKVEKPIVIHLFVKKESSTCSLLFSQKQIFEGGQKTIKNFYEISPSGVTSRLICAKEKKERNPKYLNLSQEIDILQELKRRGVKNLLNYTSRILLKKSGELKEKHFMERAECDLYEYFNLLWRASKGSLTPHFERNLLNIAQKITLNLNEIHRAGFVHFDIKTENILILEKEDTVLIDFGHAQRIGTLLTGRGTFGYIAPEVMYPDADTTAQPSADVWSFGLLLFILFYGYNPFLSTLKNLEHLDSAYALSLFHQKIEEIRKKLFSHKIPKDTLIAAMLSPNPQDRPEMVLVGFYLCTISGTIT